MLERLTSWAGETERLRLFLPLVPIAILALVEAVVLPARLWAKGVWVAAVAVGCLLGGATLMQQDKASRDASDSRIAELKGLWAQWDALSRTLPVAEAPGASFATIDDLMASLSAKVAAIDAQIAILKERATGRSISDETAARLIDHLRQYAGNHVVVSCVPNDIEAYSYANQLVTILRMAEWDARGPEMTAASAEATAMGISLFVRDPRSPEIAKILIDAFVRFNVPYRTGLTASDAIPDIATVELFVAKKP